MRRRLIADVASCARNEKLLSFIDNESIKEYMNKYSPITRRYVRSNMYTKAANRYQNEQPSLNIDQQNSTLRSAREEPAYASQPMSPGTRGSLMDFKAIIDVEDVDKTVRRSALAGGPAGTYPATGPGKARTHVHTS